MSEEEDNSLQDDELKHLKIETLEEADLDQYMRDIVGSSDDSGPQIEPVNISHSDKLHTETQLSGFNFDQGELITAQSSDFDMLIPDQHTPATADNGHFRHSFSDRSECALLSSDIEKTQYHYLDTRSEQTITNIPDYKFDPGGFSIKSFAKSDFQISESHNLLNVKSNTVVDYSSNNQSNFVMTQHVTKHSKPKPSRTISHASQLNSNQNGDNADAASILTSLIHVANVQDRQKKGTSTNSINTAETSCSSQIQIDLTVPQHLYGETEPSDIVPEWGELPTELPDSGSLQIPSTVEDVAQTAGYHELPKKKKRKKKRTKKKKPKGDAQESQRKLWQFILDTLSCSEHNPAVIKWVDRNRGMFKICDHTRLAELWTVSRHRQSDIKYEFLARALRHYYAKKILHRVPGKKLVYQFGENCQWQQYLDLIAK